MSGLCVAVMTGEAVTIFMIQSLWGGLRDAPLQLLMRRPQVWSALKTKTTAFVPNPGGPADATIQTDYLVPKHFSKFLY
jgi:hypothetical protein